MICTIHGDNPSPGVRNRCTVCQRADFTRADATIAKRRRAGRVRRWLARHRPGDMLAAYIHRLGYAPSSTCGCATMQSRMNEWGWRGCWRNRGAIVEHLHREAERIGVDAGKGVCGLLWAAWRETWRRTISMSQQDANVVNRER